MKKIFLLLLAFPVAVSLPAHPGIGIVCDSKGNIYYSDLKNVWKISPEAKKTIAVTGVHSHELVLDRNDNLYGEHLWYNGEKLNTWGHYVWRLRSDGSIDTVKGPAEGFLSDYSFLRDSAGNMYWVQRWKGVSRFIKKVPDGKTMTLAEGKFNDIRWSYCSKEGTIYFLDLDKLFKLTQDGQFKLLAEKLDDITPAFAWVGERHNAYGIWTDANDNIFVALHGGQKVKRLSPVGKMETIIYSSSPWSPTSGVFDKQGNMWLMEYTITGDCRVRKISNQESAGNDGKIKAALVNYFLPMGALALLIGLLSKFMIRKLK